VEGVSPVAIESSTVLQAVSFGVFFSKVVVLIFVTIWIRWTLPRFRVDQMMNMCWKYFIPLSFVCFVGTTAWTWLVPPLGQRVVAALIFAVMGLGLGAYFISRVVYNLRIYLKNTRNARLDIKGIFYQ
jgi:NADH-quinone oxidoreductase subunit H